MNIPFNEKEILARLSVEESEEISWINRMPGKSSIIYTSENLALKYRRAIIPASKKVFRTTDANLILQALAFSFGILLLILLYQKSINMLIFLIIFLVTSLLSIFYFRIFKKDSTKSIVITKDEIVVNGNRYNWSNIEKVYFVERPVGRGRNFLIVLVLDVSTYDKYKIFKQLDGKPYKLAAYIEYFRKCAMALFCHGNRRSCCN